MKESSIFKNIHKMGGKACGTVCVCHTSIYEKIIAYLSDNNENIKLGNMKRMQKYKRRNWVKFHNVLGHQTDDSVLPILTESKAYSSDQSEVLSMLASTR